MASTSPIIAYPRVGQGSSGLGLDPARIGRRVFGKLQFVEEFTEVESRRNSNRPVLEQELAAGRLHRAMLVVQRWKG